MPITVLDLAVYRLGEAPERMTGADFEKAGLPIFGGCQHCEASIAAYNAYPSTTGYLRCADCIGDLGWDKPAEADAAIFGDDAVPPQSDADARAEFFAHIHGVQEGGR